MKLTQTQVDEGSSINISAEMLFPADATMREAWCDYQRLLQDYRFRQQADRKALLAMLDAALSIDHKGLKAAADRAYVDGFVRGMYTVVWLETADARRALQIVRETAGKVFDTNVHRKTEFERVAPLWAAHWHFKDDRETPCKRAHLREFLGMAREYGRELEAMGKDVIQIPAHIKGLPEYRMEEVGELPTDKRSRRGKQLQGVPA